MSSRESELSLWRVGWATLRTGTWGMMKLQEQIPKKACVAQGGRGEPGTEGSAREGRASGGMWRGLRAYSIENAAPITQP